MPFNFERLVYPTILCTGSIFAGWLLMKTTVPSNDVIESNMADDLKSDKMKQLAKSKNAQFLQIMKENAKSDRPAWDVKGIKDIENSKR